MATFSKASSRKWMYLTGLFFVTTVVLLIVVIVLAAKDNGSDDDDSDASKQATVATCGEGSNPNGNSFDLSDPSMPDVFHDLTESELLELRQFLEQDADIHAAKLDKIALEKSYLFAADLLVPNKTDVLRYLDEQNGQQPERRARVMMFRGDMSPPVVEEYICGPLPNISSCALMQLKGRRNPAEFSLRPFNHMEFVYIFYTILDHVEKELGFILMESFQATYKNCGSDGVCLDSTYSPLGTSLAGGISQRLYWLSAAYKVEYKTLHPIDFAFMANLTGSDSSQWSVGKVWYAGRIYESMDELITGYNASSIPVSRLTKPVRGPQLFSTLHMRGQPQPDKPQRPPKLVEPDGKRYSVKHQKVEYLGWSFHFRMSTFSGPAIYDVRYQGERIVYELALQELAVFYSAHAPHPQTTDYVDSGDFLGTNSKALVPGADCPESATFIDTTFMAQVGALPVAKFARGICLFEQNDGTPLRRKLYYHDNPFYGGMLNSALVMRSILAIGNYDYVIDFIFYQTGAIETKMMSTGYISGTYFADYEKMYALRIHDRLGGSLHHHIVHFKADVDISGISNRYETVDISNDDTTLTSSQTQPYQMNKFTMNLNEMEQDALYEYNFDTPKYHLFHNSAKRTSLDEVKAYRLEMKGMSKQLLTPGQHNERSVPWARHQLAVTAHKDHEFWSTSSYAMWDSAQPVVDFSDFYTDNDNITDQDLVLWVSMGMHHLPHTEDLPLTTTVGNGLSFYLLPYNYFPECPSVSSRDHIRINLKDSSDGTQGVMVTRHHDSNTECTVPKSNLEEQVEEDPDSVLQSKRQTPVL